MQIEFCTKRTRGMPEEMVGCGGQACVEGKAGTPEVLEPLDSWATAQVGETGPASLPSARDIPWEQKHTQNAHCVPALLHHAVNAGNREMPSAGETPEVLSQLVLVLETVT